MLGRRASQLRQPLVELLVASPSVTPSSTSLSTTGSALSSCLDPNISATPWRRHFPALSATSSGCSYFPSQPCSPSRHRSMSQQAKLHTSASGEASHASGGANGSAAIHFRDHRAVHANASTLELARAWCVFRLCGIPWFVRNAQSLIGLGNRTIGKSATSWLIKHTFFNHFCAGETPEQVWRTMERLQKRGVSAILDYAAEDDVPAPAAAPAATKQSPAAPATAGQQKVQAEPQQQNQQQQQPKVAAQPQPQPQPLGVDTREGVVGRVYSYESELQCDRHVDTFLKAIDTAAGLPGQGFAAVKLTALGNPDLLERISNSVLTVRGLFRRFDADGSGYIDRSEFLDAYAQLFPEASHEETDKMFTYYDIQGQKKIDYVAWCQRLSLKQMPLIAESIHRAYAGRDEMRGWIGDLSASCITEEEYKMVRAMRVRLETIAERAVQKDVKLMVDAEHTYFQPAIDHLTLYLMRKYNVGGKAYIYNTYQAYLTNCHKRLVDDMERAKRENYRFACKLVRGAYLQLERTRAHVMGYPSPVWGSLEETHKSYEACLREVIGEVANGRAEVLLGSHNEASIQQAVQLMKEKGLEPGKCPVYFGQLLGMADHLTFTLGSHGYPAFKYVPYGMVHEVVPYLLRRAQENASILENAKADVALLEAEISRRLGLSWARATFVKRRGGGVLP